MFGKKQPPAAAFTLQVLTAEYLMEGLVPGNTQFDFPEYNSEPRPLTLASAQIQPIGPGGGAAWSAASFYVYGHSTIAYLPRQEPAAMAQHGLWKLYDQPMQGTFYVGPYVMQGQALLINAGAVELMTPIVNARISSRAPGAHLSEIQAPFAVVNMRWLHGYETA